MNVFRRTTSVCLLLFGLLNVMAQGPNNSGTYYKNADGKKGSALKTALAGIISNHKTIGYDGLLSCYHTTDKRADGKLWDMYSDNTSYVIGGPAENHQYKKEGDGYNREHSVPQSWFKEASPMKSDLVHVVPTDGYVNNRRSNFPFGETNGETYKSHNGFSKVGKCTTSGYSGTVFEPNDEYKGDFARIYFYMATCYESRISGWSGGVFGNGTYPGIVKWELDMLLRWAKEDPVSQKEIDRNNEVYKQQQNRNPYVDYPGLEQYVWGDKTDVAFDYDSDGIVDPNPDPDPDPDPNPDPDPEPSEGEIVFEKVTLNSELTAGTGYIIVCDEKNMALSASSSDVRSNVSVSISGNKITTDVNQSGKPYVLTLGGTAGAYTFYDATEKCYLALTTDGNKLQSSTDATTNNAKWSVNISGGTAMITSNAYSSRAIYYNNSSPRFACYNSSNSQTPVSLYKQTSTSGIQQPKVPTFGKVNVYSITGFKVRSNVNADIAIDGLPNGIYIVDGRKIVVR